MEPKIGSTTITYQDSRYVGKLEKYLTNSNLIFTFFYKQSTTIGTNSQKIEFHQDTFRQKVSEITTIRKQIMSKNY